MNRRENVLFKILLTVIILASYYLSSNYFTNLIDEDKSNIVHYENLKNKMLQKKAEAEQENAILVAIKETEKVDEISMAELLETILSDLKKCGIKPERYQINIKGKKEYVDFTIKCNAPHFTNYLNSFKNGTYPYTVSSYNIKTEEEGLSAVLRYELTPSINCDSDFIERKNAVQKMLRSPYKPPKEVPVKEEKKVEKKEEKKVEVPEKIIDGKGKYRVIGYIKNSDNINYLYLKTTTGRMIKVPPENILEEDKDKYILRLENEKIKIYK